MKNIRIEYGRGYFGRIRTLKLDIDGKIVGTMKQGQSLNLEVEANAKCLRGRMDWGQTHPFDLSTVQDGDIITITPSFSLNPFRNIGLLNMPIQLSQKPPSAA